MCSSIFNVQTHILPCQHIREYPRATAESQEDILELHIKQYTPIENIVPQSGAVTIIGAHANGFPKELYEPLWDEIYQRAKRHEFSIRGFWIADVSHQGMSSVLNEVRIGNDPSWFDHSRDLLHMINHFRDQMPRPLIGIGHSMGGCQLVNLSLIHPRLLSTLVLLDPVIHIYTDPPNTYPTPTEASIYRRDLWPSRASAAASTRKSKFYQVWDPRVLELWLKHGLRDLPTTIYPETSDSETAEKPVTLTTTRHQEVFSFLRPNFSGTSAQGNPTIYRYTHADLDPTTSDTYPFYRPEPVITFHNLPFLRPSVLYIFGGQSGMSYPKFRKQKLENTGIGVGGSGGAKEGRVKDVVLENIGHLVAMEAVGDCADAAAEWLGVEMRRWREEEEEFGSMWGRKTKLEKVVVGEEWEKRVRRPARPKEESPSKL